VSINTETPVTHPTSHVDPFYTEFLRAYKKAAQMETKIQDVVKLAAQVSSTNEAARKDVVTASQKAFAELQRGWAGVVSRFR
jgi:hypothetical protein